jgi:hypothetical protein
LKPVIDEIDFKSQMVRFIHLTQNLGLAQHRLLAMAPGAAVREPVFVGATAVDQPCTTR